MTRQEEYDKFIAGLSKEPHEMYCEIDITWAYKFIKFYGWDDDTAKQLVKRLKVFNSRSPIGTLIDHDGIRHPYRLSWYGSFEDELDRMLHKIDRRKYIKLIVDEDISVIKNCLVQTANYRGLDTLVELHGVLGAKQAFLPLTAKKISVWDIRQKNKLISWGLDENRIDVDGYNRRYAKYTFMNKEKISKKVARDFKIKDIDRLLLVAPYTRTNYGDGGEHVIENTHNFMKEAMRNTLRPVIIKLHPGSEDLKYWQDWAKPYSHIRVVKNYNPDHLSLASSLMVVHHSTYALDGYMMNRKVYIIDDGLPSGLEEFDGWFPKITNFEEMMSAIS